MAINKDLEGKLLQFIGVENIETEDDFNSFKESFNTRFVPRETAHRDEGIAKTIIGKRMGEITSALNDFGKSVGLDVSYEKLKEKTIEDNIADFKDMIGGKINELSTKAKDGNDKKVNDLLKQIEEKEKSLHSYKEANEQLTGKMAETETMFSQKINDFKVGSQLKDMKSSIAWVDGINDVQRAGFDALLSSKYKFNLGEGDKVEVTDTDGNLIPLKDKAGQFADAKTVIQQLAEENGLVKKNNASTDKKKVVYLHDKSDTDVLKGRVNSSYEERKRKILR